MRKALQITILRPSGGAGGDGSKSGGDGGLYGGGAGTAGFISGSGGKGGQGLIVITYVAGILVKPPNNLGLIGYWPFNEGTGSQAGDFSGFGHTGTLSTNGGSLPTWVNGRWGGALTFNGTDSYVAVGNAAASVQTISFWIKTSVATQHIIDLDGGTHQIQMSGSQITATGFTGAYIDGTLATTSVTLDTGWHFVVATSFATFAASAMDIGRVVSASSYFSGTLDEVRIYSRALSASDIINLYDQGTAGATQIQSSSAQLTNGTTLGPSGGLVGPDLNWQTGIALDRSGQGNNGNDRSDPGQTRPGTPIRRCEHLRKCRLCRYHQHHFFLGEAAPRR
jgi:Concanavalin A-like lectin/glucanases superfamily